MADSTDVILQLSEKQWSSALRARDRMASLTNALVICVAVLQGSIVVAGFDTPAVVAAALIVALGGGGLLASRRHARRFQLEMDRCKKLAVRLDELTPDAGLVAMEYGPIEDGDRGVRPGAVVHLGLVGLGIINVALVLLL
ncbi:MAG: hypothetical protein ACYTGF_08490 [Planctomycetota bacterium]|jgi:hypothetical protein